MPWWRSICLTRSWMVSRRKERIEAWWFSTEKRFIRYFQRTSKRITFRMDCPWIWDCTLSTFWKSLHMFLGRNKFNFQGKRPGARHAHKNWWSVRWSRDDYFWSSKRSKYGNTLENFGSCGSQYLLLVSKEWTTGEIDRLEDYAQDTWPPKKNKSLPFLWFWAVSLLYN